MRRWQDLGSKRVERSIVNIEAEVDSGRESEILSVVADLRIREEEYHREKRANDLHSWSALRDIILDCCGDRLPLSLFGPRRISIDT